MGGLGDLQNCTPSFLPKSDATWTLTAKPFCAILTPPRAPQGQLTVLCRPGAVAVRLSSSSRPGPRSRDGSLSSPPAPSHRGPFQFVTLLFQLLGHFPTTSPVLELKM